MLQPRQHEPLIPWKPSSSLFNSYWKHAELTLQKEQGSPEALAGAGKLENDKVSVRRHLRRFSFSILLDRPQ